MRFQLPWVKKRPDQSIEQLKKELKWESPALKRERDRMQRQWDSLWTMQYDGPGKAVRDERLRLEERLILQKGLSRDEQGKSLGKLWQRYHREAALIEPRKTDSNVVAFTGGKKRTEQKHPLLQRLVTEGFRMAAQRLRQPETKTTERSANHRQGIDPER